MALVIEEAGLSTTIQDNGRAGQGLRRMGVPDSGAADTLSLALANYLAGKPPGAAALEFTLTGGRIRFELCVSFALAGGEASCTLNDEPVSLYRQYEANPGDVLAISPLRFGCRLYLAISDDLQAEDSFGSVSTYVPAGFGGHHGRALSDSDVIATVGGTPPEERSVPEEYRPFFNKAHVLRVVEGPEAGWLAPASREAMVTQAFAVGQRASRQGVELSEPVLSLAETKQLASSAVFPGTVQCPPSGKPYLLAADAQTTGGYARIAQVIRADRHQIGQVCPGDTVRFMPVTPDEAATVLREKNTLYRKLLGADIF